MAAKKQHAPAPTPDEISALSSEMGFAPTQDQAQSLAAYLWLVMKWNKVMNLVGKKNWRTVFKDLVLDSFHLERFIRELSLPAAPLCLDFGAGAGLPGIPLRILWNDGDYVLVESREKRATFMRNALALSGVKNTRVFAGRVEDMKEPPADLVVSRAFMPWPEYLALARERMKPGGVAVVMASEACPGEVEDWDVVASLDYPSPSGSRFFWGLTPAKA